MSNSPIDKNLTPEIMTPEEVAQFLRKSTSWVYKNWQALGGRKLGGSLFFPRKEDLYERLFKDVFYHVRRWVKEWNGLICTDITSDMIERYIIKRSAVSACVANKELQYLRALFNYGIKRKLITSNPTDDIEFLPVAIQCH